MAHSFIFFIIGQVRVWSMPSVMWLCKLVMACSYAHALNLLRQRRPPTKSLPWIQSGVFVFCCELDYLNPQLCSKLKLPMHLPMCAWERAQCDCQYPEYAFWFICIFSFVTLPKVFRWHFVFPIFSNLYVDHSQDCNTQRSTRFDVLPDIHKPLVDNPNVEL